VGGFKGRGLLLPFLWRKKTKKWVLRSVAGWLQGDRQGTRRPAVRRGGRRRKKGEGNRGQGGGGAALGSNASKRKSRPNRSPKGRRRGVAGSQDGAADVVVWFWAGRQASAEPGGRLFKPQTGKLARGERCGGADFLWAGFISPGGVVDTGPGRGTNGPWRACFFFVFCPPFFFPPPFGVFTHNNFAGRAYTRIFFSATNLDGKTAGSGPNGRMSRKRPTIGAGLPAGAGLGAEGAFLGREVV